MSSEPRPTPRPGRPPEASAGPRRPPARPARSVDEPSRSAEPRPSSSRPDASSDRPAKPRSGPAGEERSGTGSGGVRRSSTRSGSSRHRPSPIERAAAAHRKRTAAILGVGCLIILVGVGGLLQQWSVAIGGCIGWIVVMVWSARNDRTGGARR